jgi:hypothetical protein
MILFRKLLMVSIGSGVLRAIKLLRVVNFNYETERKIRKKIARCFSIHQLCLEVVT